MVHFLNGSVYRASWPFPMSIRANDPVYHQTIFPVRVTMFPSGMLVVWHLHSRVETCPRGRGHIKSVGIPNPDASKAFVNPNYIYASLFDHIHLML